MIVSLHAHNNVTFHGQARETFSNYSTTQNYTDSQISEKKTKEINPKTALYSVLQFHSKVIPSNLLGPPFSSFLFVFC